MKPDASLRCPGTAAAWEVNPHRGVVAWSSFAIQGTISHPRWEDSTCYLSPRPQSDATSTAATDRARWPKTARDWASWAGERRGCLAAVRRASQERGRVVHVVQMREGRASCMRWSWLGRPVESRPSLPFGQHPGIGSDWPTNGRRQVVTRVRWSAIATHGWADEACVSEHIGSALLSIYIITPRSR